MLRKEINGNWRTNGGLSFMSDISKKIGNICDVLFIIFTRSILWGFWGIMWFLLGYEMLLLNIWISLGISSIALLIGVIFILSCNQTRRGYGG
jgi:hypothetical protein